MQGGRHCPHHKCGGKGCGAYLRCIRTRFCVSGDSHAALRLGMTVVIGGWLLYWGPQKGRPNWVVLQFVKKVPTKRNPLPRGEGGPPERSSEKAGRERNAGGNLKVYATYRPEIRLDFDEAHRKSQHFSYPRFLPAFLFSHQSVPKSRLATASPRGKRLGCSRTRRFFDSLKCR